MAAPTSEVNLPMQKRKPILSDSDQIAIDGKVPLDAILLVGAGLLTALVCFCWAIWNVYAPNSSGTQRVRDERAQANMELRLKGAGGSSSVGTISPTRVMMEKKRHHSNTPTDVLSVDSHSKLMTNPAMSARYGPKIANNAARSSRASRGYSSYSKHDVSSFAKSGRMNSASMLAVPTLSNTQGDASSHHSVSSGSGSTSSPSEHLPWQVKPSMPRWDRALSENEQSRRVSTTHGRGIDVNRNRSKKNQNRNVHVNPQAVESSYSNQRRTSPPGSSNESQDPLAGYELKRFTTDPSDSREGSRRNSSMNALDFFGYNSGGSPIYANRTYTNTDSGSDTFSHEALEGPSTPMGLPRTRQMMFYDADQEVPPSPDLRQESALLAMHSHSRYASPTKKERKVWDGRY